ncbi:MAG: alpha-hydroxy-acid oxidizing protein [Streptosporangiales bacterium]|nr:alpha-hydroxy-acid oxidizing protein [Streptosporangiales bacterium]
MRTIDAVVRAAGERLHPHVLDYVLGGAETETTLRRNREAYERRALVPRVLRDVGSVDLSTTMLGTPLALPVVLAPIGSLSLVDPDGAVASARAAASAGTTCVVGLMAKPGFAEVAAAVPEPMACQLYVRGDDRWLADVVRRVEDLGYRSVHLTVDSAVYGRRVRDLVNGFSPREAADRPDHAGQGGPRGAAYQAALTWDVVDRLRAATTLPIVLKGVVSAADARLAVEHGVDGVYVSNHGGRQLDYGCATLDRLGDVVSAVAGRAEIGFDGGVRHGTDVVMALALGARWVGIGRLQALGLAAAGEQGVRRVLDLLAEEMRSAVALLGSRTPGDLCPEDVTTYP